jgi:hypothetical protein
MRRAKNFLIISWKRNACRLVEGATKGTSLLGISKRRWDDNIKMILKEITCSSFFSVTSTYTFQDPFL